MEQNIKDDGMAENKFRSLVNYEYNGVVKHPHMSASSRAAQFAPFAALPIKKSGSLKES